MNSSHRAANVTDAVPDIIGRGAPAAREALSLWARKLPESVRQSPIRHLIQRSSTSGEALFALARALGGDLATHFRVSRCHTPLVAEWASHLEPEGAARVLRASRPLLSGDHSLVWGFEAYCAAHAGTLLDGEQRVLGELYRELVLHEVDLRLQVLYRAWLLSGGHDPLGEHALAALEVGTRPLVDAFLGALDVPQIGGGFEDDSHSEERFLERLQNLAFEPQRQVTFRFTYHCNLACAHCYNHSGARRKAQRIDDTKMLATIAQMRSAGMDRVNLSGGEPFLYMDTVTAMIRQARQCGIKRVNINTNGFWARSEQDADRVLVRLVEAGFRPGEGGAKGDTIKVSSGRFHQEAGVSLERIAILARVYLRRFSRPVELDYSASTEEETAAGRLWEELGRRGIDKGQAELHVRRVSAIGRGAALTDRAGGEAGEAFGRCRLLGQLAFDPDGRCRPCCGLNSENAGIVVGSIHEDSLRACVKHMQNSPLLQAMHREPMGRLLDWVPGRWTAASFSGLCELCNGVLGDWSAGEIGRRLPEGVRARARFYPHWLV